jgi:hypothetical protein
LESLTKPGFACAKGSDGVRKRQNVTESLKDSEKLNLDAIALLPGMGVPARAKVQIHVKPTAPKFSPIIYTKILPLNPCTCYIFSYMFKHCCFMDLHPDAENMDAKFAALRSIN